MWTRGYVENFDPVYFSTDLLCCVKFCWCILFRSISVMLFFKENWITVWRGTIKPNSSDRGSRRIEARVPCFKFFWQIALATTHADGKAHSFLTSPQTKELRTENEQTKAHRVPPSKSRLPNPNAGSRTVD